MRDDPPLPRTLAFLRRIWAMTHAVQARSKRMERLHSVTGPQRFVLRVVGRFPGVSAGDLARILELHPSTMTGILQRLEERELLTRTTDPDDGRRFLFRLTDDGIRFDAERRGTIEAAVRRALARLDDAEVKKAEKVLAVLVEELEREEA